MVYNDNGTLRLVRDIHNIKELVINDNGVIKKLPKVDKLLCNIDANALVGDSYLIPASKQGSFYHGNARYSLVADNVGFSSTTNSTNNNTKGRTSDLKAYFIGKNHNSPSNYISYRMPFNDRKTKLTLSYVARFHSPQNWRGNIGLGGACLRMESKNANRLALYARNLGSYTTTDGRDVVDVVYDVSRYMMHTLTIDNTIAGGGTYIKLYVDGAFYGGCRFANDIGVENLIYFSVKYDSATEIYQGNNIFIKSLRYWEDILDEDEILALSKYEGEYN